MSIQQSEVDGLPVLTAPTDGPSCAGLVFRVGRADESLARSGVTHLLEHLALFRVGLTDYHYNASTGAVVTSFHSTGDDRDLVTYLSAVCDGLNHLPLERLGTEKAVVRTEHQNRVPAANDSMNLWRYGARGYGLLSYGELGLPALVAQDLEHWAQTWFTRNNAVLWIAGDQIPVGLRLDLPDGVHQPVPQPTSALPATPAYFCEGHQTVVLDAIVLRRPAAWVFANVLERSLFRHLRQELGISYATNVAVEPRGDGYVTVTALVDGRPEQADAVVGGFVDTLGRLRVGRIDQADLDAYMASWRDAARHHDIDAAGLPAAAFDLLTGAPVRSLDERSAALHAVTIGDVHEVAVEAMSTALLRVPYGTRADWAGFVPAPTQSAAAVTGVRLPSLDDPSASLLVGAEGVSTVTDYGPVTVRFDDCAAMVAWPDGGRRLIGNDGLTVAIEPTVHRIDAATLAGIDAAVPGSRVVSMPAREPSAIPQAGPTQSAARAPRKAWEIAVMVASLIATTAVLCLASALSLASTEDTGGPDDIGMGAVVASWVCVLAVATPGVLLLLRRRRMVRP
jgi:zinc protease